VTAETFTDKQVHWCPGVFTRRAVGKRNLNRANSCRWCRGKVRLNTVPSNDCIA
jgi:hypothetical protein